MIEVAQWAGGALAGAALAVVLLAWRGYVVPDHELAALLRSPRWPALRNLLLAAAELDPLRVNEVRSALWHEAVDAADRARVQPGHPSCGVMPLSIPTPRRRALRRDGGASLGGRA